MVFTSDYSDALIRDYLNLTLSSTCELMTYDSDGDADPAATVACEVVYPRAQQGTVYPDDQRHVQVMVPADTQLPDSIKRVVVDGNATYRVTNIPPYRKDLLRTIECVEARG